MNLKYNSVVLLGFIHIIANKIGGPKENQKPNSKALSNQHDFENKGTVPKPQGLEKCTSRQCLSQNFNFLHIWPDLLQSIKLRQDGHDVTQGIKIREPPFPLHFQGNVMLWRDFISVCYALGCSS